MRLQLLTTQLQDSPQTIKKDLHSAQIVLQYQRGMNPQEINTMAHGLENGNDMVFNGLNKKPWHGLGVELAGLATAQDILDACPSFAAPVNKEQATRNGQDIQGHFWTVRSDTDTVLAHVGAEYVVMQNADLLRVAEKFVHDPQGPVFETAGILWGGRKSWVLAKFPDDMIIRGRNGAEDVVGQYLLFSNAHDGTQRLRVQMTPIRVVCNNTLNMAHGSKQSNTSAYVCHSGDVTAKLANVADLLGIAQREFAQTQELFQALASKEPTQAQINQVMEQLFPTTVTDRSKLQRNRVMELATVGAGNNVPGIQGTGWALYNGVTELVDHVNNQGSKRSDAQDMRVNSIWFGSGQAFKAEALQTIAKVCLN